MEYITENCYLKCLRLTKRIRKKNVSKYCGFSSQYLTALEDNQSFINPQIFRKLTAFYGMKVKKTEDNELYILYNMYFVNYININSEENNLIFSKLTSMNPVWSTSFPVYLIISFLHFISTGKLSHFSENDFIYVLPKIKMQLPTYYRQIIDLSLGIYYNNLNKLNLSVSHFMKVIEHNDNLLLAMSYYYLSIVYLRKYKSLVALQYLNQAKSIFDNSNVYVRSAQCISHKVIVCIQQNDYDLALEYSNTAIELGKRFSKKNILSVNYWNQCHIHFVRSDLENLLLISNEYLNLCNLANPLLYFMIARTYLKHNLVNECHYWCNKGLKQSDFNKKSTTYKLLQYCSLLAKNSQMAIKLLNEAEVSLMDNNDDVDLKIMVYNEIINYYRVLERYDISFIYCQKLFGLKNILL